MYSVSDVEFSSILKTLKLVRDVTIRPLAVPTSALEVPYTDAMKQALFSLSLPYMKSKLNLFLI